MCKGVYEAMAARLKCMFSIDVMCIIVRFKNVCFGITIFSGEKLGFVTNILCFKLTKGSI